jgi:hypothetical protein
MYEIFYKEREKTVSFFVKKAVFSSFNKVYAPFLLSFPRYFVISPKILKMYRNNFNYKQQKID